MELGSAKSASPLLCVPSLLQVESTKRLLFWPALNHIPFFPGISDKTEVPIQRPVVTIRGSYWSHHPGFSFFFFFCSHWKKSKYWWWRFSKAEQRENAPNLLAFKGSRSLNCTLWLWKSPVYLPNAVFAQTALATTAGEECDLSVKNRWSLIIDDHDLERRHPWGDLCWNEAPVIIKYSFLVLMASKILIVILFVWFWLTGKAFLCTHFGVKRADFEL